MQDTRLNRLISKRDQISARIARLSAKNVAQQRRDETRKKIVAGAILLDAVDKDRGAEKPTGIARWWDSRVATLTRPQDKRLFAPDPPEGRSRAEQGLAQSPTGD